MIRGPVSERDPGEEGPVDDGRRALIEDHVELVDRVVAQLGPTLPGHLDRGELVAAGRLGLTEAAQRFDPDTGIPFGAFAIHRIRGAVLDLARSFDYLPARVRAMHRRVSDAAQILRSEHGEEPSDEELADALMVDTIDLRRLRRQVASGPNSSLDASSATDRPLVETISDRGQMDTEERAEEHDLLDGVLRALDHLPERLRLVVTATYLEGRSGLEVSELLAVSPARISQLRAEALELLRAELTDIVEVRIG